MIDTSAAESVRFRLIDGSEPLVFARAAAAMNGFSRGPDALGGQA